jgi:hypothetical protein
MIIKDLLEREINVGDYVVTRKSYSETDLQVGRVVKLHSNGGVTVARACDIWDNTIQAWVFGINPIVGTFKKGSRLCIVAEKDVPSKISNCLNTVQLNFELGS